ncbi:MAG: alpha/beta fold hydrolase [Thermoanaerobaculaceae bacterium]|nr:alpha/beta fold hydrolase [Thermoanaerobaculaceae bacterium]
MSRWYSLVLSCILGGLACLAGEAVVEASAQPGDLVTARLTHVRQRPGTYSETFLVAGTERSARIHLPPSYNGSSALPVVILLHGEGGDPRQVESMSRFAAEADRQDLILVTPWGTGEPRGWNTGGCCASNDDAAFLRELASALLAELTVDEKRIALVGYSSGGTLALQAAPELAEQLAVVAAVSPNPPTLSAHWPAVGEATSRVALLLVTSEGGSAEPTGADATTARWWAASNGCGPLPDRQWTPNGSASILSFPGCRDGIDVVLLSVPDAGRSWPGGRAISPGATNPPDTPSATAHIIDFLTRHPRW